MDGKIINGLKDLGYAGPLLEKNQLDVALEEGAKSIEYTKLVNYLTHELRSLLSLDEEVNPITVPEDSVAFIMEVSSFLKELNCPYSSLLSGHISDRLQSVSDKLLLLDFLSTELMGARVLQEKKPDKKIELKLQETDEAAQMRQILMTMRFPKPPPNITISQLFQKLIPTIQSTIQKPPGSELVGNPAFNGHLSDKQWEILNTVQQDLHKEYKIRREMLLTRLDVTIQSFQWSDKTKGKDDLFEKAYSEKRKKLKADPSVDLSNLIAARDEIAIIEKTSNSSVRKNTRSSLNKVIIGQVPDRGGRTSEQAPPPPEMPSWQQRTPGPSSGRGNFNKQQRGNYNNQGSSRDSYNNQGRRGSYGNNSNQSFDSAGSYGGNKNAGYNYDNASSSYGNKGDNRYDNTSSYHGNNRSGSDYSFDSAGSYGNQYEHNSKRVKTYDSFQSNRTSYADQYVQEEQHNRQYGGRGGQNRGRGRSNYNRGGRSNY